MSILLEALRKSEKGQTPVEPPTIHTDQQISMPSEPVRKGPLAGFLLLALLLIAWIVWQQYEPTGVNKVQPQASPAKQGTAIKTPVSSMPVNDVASSPTDTTRARPAKRRTPVEVYQPDTLADSSPAANQATTTRRGTSGSSTSGPDTAKSRLPVAAGADRRAGKVSAQEPAGAGGAQTKQPQPISYWELPDAIRADVPEIKFSVLVYANEPGNRFVLVNGQRLVEGDSYGQGLEVAEIRRDGVVFSYRLYRFLVER